MFFEGSEKKVEVVVAPGSPSLRKLGREYWEKIVAECRATILSTISNDNVDAYLLSESSLFVWDDRFLMITCGRTVLVNSVLAFTNSFDQSAVESIIFQRKNEYDSREQISSFLEDISKIRGQFPGQALRFGNLDGHYTYLFHMDKSYEPTPDDYTTELLMYHIEGDRAEILRMENQPVESVRDALGIEKMLPDFLFDDFVFSPFGYSMNGIRGENYVTVHITPQEDSSYVSFETDLDLNTYCPELIDHLVNTLKPHSFDLVTFNYDVAPEKKDGLICASVYKDKLKCGYDVNFSHYMRGDENEKKPIRL